MQGTFFFEIFTGKTSSKFFYEIFGDTTSAMGLGNQPAFQVGIAMS
jgi:hypothetical protein